MVWSDAFGKELQPTLQQVAGYIKNPCFDALCANLTALYGVEPQFSYNGFDVPGWTLKYRCSGKALCTLYPREGYCTALIVIGNKEQQDAELLMPGLSSATQELYQRTRFSAGGRWLMMDVLDENVLTDATKLISLRVKPKRKV